MHLRSCTRLAAVPATSAHDARQLRPTSPPRAQPPAETPVCNTTSNTHQPSVRCDVRLLRDPGAAVQGPEVRSGDLNEPAELVPGEEWVFTINEGEKGVNRRISVNYDGFVHDVGVGDELLVDGGIMTFKIKDLTATDVVCTVRPPSPRPGTPTPTPAVP